MDRNRRYPLRFEGLRKDSTTSDVRRFLKCPSQDDVVEKLEIFSHGSTATAIAVLSQPDAACEFLNAKDPVIDGCRVTLSLELFEEMSITFNGSWLEEIEKENPTIQVEIQKIADKFNLQLGLQKSIYWDTKAISLTGVPWKIEQARAHLNDKIQAIIMNRSRNVVKRKWDDTHFRPDVAGSRSPNDPKSGVENKGSSECDNRILGKKRERALKTVDTKGEMSVGAANVSTNDVKTDQMKIGKRNRVLKNPKPDEMQKSESPAADALGKTNLTHYRSSTQFQAVIRVEIDKHRYLVEHSTRLNFTDSSMSQYQVSEEQIDWIIGDNNEKDIRRNEEELKSLIDKLLIKCYTAPAEFDFDTFQNQIEADNKNEDVTLIFDPKTRSCRVVGLLKDVEPTYKWISEISGQLVRGIQKPGRGSTSDASDDSMSFDSGSSSQHFDTQQSGSQRYPQNYSSHNSQGRFPDPKVTKAVDGIRISKRSSKDRLELETHGNLRVSVYQGNMIKQATEVIVNPANECLGHGGGLARVILDAAGPVLDDESRQIISKQGKIKTSEVVHTSAGKLPPPIKYVVHAVGPTAYEFKDNKAGLVPTLKVTFRNCLDYANEKLCVSSISLPPISSGIFAVPMPDIIRGAVEAIQEFDRKNPLGAVLREVHFISNDAKTTEEMISCFRNLIA